MNQEFEELIYWLSLTDAEITKVPDFVSVGLIKVPVASRNMRSSFNKNVNKWALFRLCAIIKKCLNTYLKIDAKFAPLIEKLREHLVETNQKNLEYLPDSIEALRKIRNCIEYQEGEVKDYELKDGDTYKHPVFKIALNEKTGTMKFSLVYETKTYRIGNEIEVPTRDSMVSFIFILRAFFFNEGMTLGISYQILSI